jgi:phosphate starvation-inducible protein PhoH
MYCWTGDTHRRVSFKNLKSHALGNIKPYKGDIYQSLFVDSLTHNKITLVKGAAGTGKTFLSMAFLMHELE